MTKVLPVRQFTKAPQQWRLPNSGQLVPGSRFLGNSHNQKMGLELPDNHLEVFMHLRWREQFPTKSSINAKGEGVDDTDKIKDQKKEREKHLRLLMNFAKWKKNLESKFMSSRVRPSVYYASSFKSSDSANFNRGSALFSNRTDSTRTALWQYQRYFNPRFTVKDPVKIDEGDQSYGNNYSSSKDVFLHRAPFTQARGSFNIGDNNATDGKQLHPTGVADHDFAKWWHSSWSRRQGVYKAASNRLKGNRAFFRETGTTTNKSNDVFNWYKQLQNQDVPRDTTELTNPKIGWCNSKQRPLQKSRHHINRNSESECRRSQPIYDPLRITSYEGHNEGWVLPSLPDYKMAVA